MFKLPTKKVMNADTFSGISNTLNLFKSEFKLQTTLSAHSTADCNESYQWHWNLDAFPRPHQLLLKIFQTINPNRKSFIMMIMDPVTPSIRNLMRMSREALSDNKSLIEKLRGNAEQRQIRCSTVRWILSVSDSTRHHIFHLQRSSVLPFKHSLFVPINHASLTSITIVTNFQTIFMPRTKPPDHLPLNLLWKNILR